MIIQIDTERLNELKITPDQYVMLYYLCNKLDCIISPQIKSELERLQFIDKDGNITLLGKSIFDAKLIIELENNKIDNLLKQMVEYFPKGIKTGGLPVRSSINWDLRLRMKRFKEEFTYSDEIILNACKSYSEDRKKDGYKYMKVFKYFIGKRGDGSLLADYCEMVLQNVDVTEKKLSDYNIKLD